MLSKNSFLRNRIVRNQEIFFTILYITTLLVYPVSSYITDFLGISTNIISIISRALTVLLVLFYLIFLIRFKLFITPPAFWLFLLFWLIYIVRIFHDTYYHADILGRSVSDYYLFAIVLSFLLSCILFSAYTPDLRKLELYFFIIILLLNILGLYNTYKLQNLFIERLGGNDRLNQITTGMIASWLFVFCLFYLFIKRKVPRYLKIMSIAGLVFSIFNILVSSSKSSFVFIGTTAFFLLIFRKTSFRISKALIIFIVIVIMGVVIFPQVSDYLELASSRFEYFGTDQSAEDRIEAYEGAFNQFKESPLLGSFLEEKGLRQYPHNLILEGFMAIGIFGGLLFIVLFIIYLVNALKFIKAYPFSPIPFITLSTITISLTSGGLSFSIDFWQHFALCIGLMYNQKQYAKYLISNKRLDLTLQENQAKTLIDTHN